jgi:hypothetical protein
MKLLRNGVLAARASLLAGLLFIPPGACALAAKPPPPPPPPPPPSSQHKLLVEFDGGDTTLNWWTKFPGHTPSTGLSQIQEDSILNIVRQGVAEGNFNLAIAEYSGEALVYGQTFLIVVGGDMAWAAPEYPPGSTSGLSFQGSFFGGNTNNQHKSFSCAPVIFGNNETMIAYSILLEGVATPSGLSQHLGTSGYSGNFTQGGGWTASEVLYLQNVHGVGAPSVPEPHNTAAIAICILLTIYTRWRPRQ